MSIKKLENKKIALLGFGLENQALLRYLLKNKLKAEITVCDRRSLDQLPSIPKNIKNQLGESFNKNLDKFDLLFRSPGWPLNCPGIRTAQKKKKEISSAMNLFLELCPSKNIIGVTGTKGKGTTATLIYKIIKAGGKKVFLGGNIGIAPFSFLEKIKKDSYLVLELSSFQLEDIKFSPQISIIINLYREHLSPADPLNPNYHPSFSAYKKAKLNIGFFQKKNNYLILNKNFFSLSKQIKKLPGKKIFFQASFTSSKLTGDYYRDNVGAAEEVAKILKIKKEIRDKAIKNFSNLPYRLEFVAEKNKVKYYNNSFSTTPESSILDLRSFENIVLIAGGADKGADFLPFAKEIKKRVKKLALLSGTGTKRLLKDLQKINYKDYQVFDSMEKAVIWAEKQSSAGDSVLLSTACASFGLFKNYKERAKLFNEAVKNL